MENILILSIIEISALIFDVWSSAIVKKRLQSVKSDPSVKSVKSVKSVTSVKSVIRGSTAGFRQSVSPEGSRVQRRGPEAGHDPDFSRGTV